MRVETREFIVTGIETAVTDVMGRPLGVEVTARHGDDEVRLRLHADAAPGISDLMRVTFSWGDGE